MTMPSALVALEYAPETAFAESSSTFATHRIPMIGPIDPNGLLWEKQESGVVKQYMHGDAPYVLMGQGGTFKTKLDLTGHGTTTVGSPTIDAMETFWGYVWGNASASLPTSTTFTGDGDETAPTTAASGTFPAGAMASLGVLGDGAGNGQLHAIATHSATTLNLLTGMATAPTNGAVLRAATNFYFHETPFGPGLNATTPGLRFRFLTPNLQYACHGCVPTGLTLSGLSPGERPQAEITWTVSRWAAVAPANAFPSSLTSNQYNPAPAAAGSLFVNDVGTATRVTRTYRQLSIDITLGMQMMPAPGGVSAYQKYGGCTRMPSTVKWSWIEDADAAPTTTPTLQGFGTGTTSKHILATINTPAGFQVGFYSPNVRVSSVPVQYANNGINSVKFEGMAHTGPTTTNDLTASSLRMAYS